MRRILSIITLVAVLLPISMASVPAVKASGCSAGSNTIVLPFSTAWGNTQPKGTAFSPSCYGAPQIVDSSSNFFSSSGSGSPSLNLAMASTGGFTAWGGASGFGPGPGDGPYLEANGYFGGSNSYGILKLFDNAAGDTGSHFLVKPHTFINIWYYHYAAGASQNIMVDGLLYNTVTHGFALIGDFSTTDSGGTTRYVVDQNNIRMSAAYRGSDQTGSWQHSVFSLDPIYYSGTDRDNWYVMAIYVRSDNSVSGSTGAAVTFFSDFRVTYAVTTSITVYDAGGAWGNPGSSTNWLDSSSQAGPFSEILMAEAWYQFQPTPTTTSFQIKVTVFARSYASATGDLLNFQIAYPDDFGITVTQLPNGMGSVTLNKVATAWYQPTGANLTSEDTSSNGWAHFLLDTAVSLIGMVPFPGLGLTLTAYQIASEAYGLLQSANPSNQLTYSWLTDISKMTIVLKGTGSSTNWKVTTNSALGEIYLTADSIPNGQSVSVPIYATTKFAFGPCCANGQSNTFINTPVNSPTISLGLSTVADSPSTLSLPPQANFVNSNGGYVTSITFGVGDEMRLSTQVPATTSPVSIQAFTNGGAGKVHPWYVDQTGWNYVLDFGPAPNLPGTYSTYTITTFADGTIAQSNTVTATIQAPFSISASQPTPQSYVAGASAMSTVTIASFNFQGNIALSPSVTPPSGVTCGSNNCPTVSFSSNPVYVASSATATSSMAISIPAATSTGSYTITITGSGGSYSYSASTTIGVVAFNFYDDFSYNSIGAMTSAGWTMCSTAPSSYYSVANSVLTLQNDGSTGANVCWNQIPGGVSDWSISTKTEWSGASWGNLGLIAYTSTHSYLFHADGYVGRWDLERDGAGVSYYSRYTPQLNVWHTMELDMRQGTLYLVWDGGILGAYSESSPGTLTQITLPSMWQTYQSYDWASAGLTAGLWFTYSPPSPHINQVITFNAATSYGSAPYSDSWNFGDNSPTTTGSTVTHSYSSAGANTVTLTATDSTGKVESLSQTIHIGAISSFTFTPTSPQVGSTVTFTGQASGGSSPYTFSWNFGDGATATGATVTHSYSVHGTYTVTLTVTDSLGQTLTSSQTIVVQTLPLTPSFTFSPTTPTAGQTVSFSGTVSGGTTPYQLSWTFGDGTTATGTFTPSHSYIAAGCYAVTFKVTDANGSTASTTQNVPVGTTCGGGSDGSVAYGSLVTLVDGSRIPVQNVKVGDIMLGYDTATGRYTTSTVLSIKAVSTNNMMIIHTQSGVPFRVDANPKQTLWVKTPDGNTEWMPVTQIQPGDDLLTPSGWTVVTSIEFAPAGNHTMFDIVATMPYFTDNYLDPLHK